MWAWQGYGRGMGVVGSEEGGAHAIWCAQYWIDVTGLHSMSLISKAILTKFNCVV